MAAATSFPASASPGSSFSFYGTWRINKLVGYSDISINPDDLKKLVGKNVVISKDRLKVGNDDDCRITQAHESFRETTRLLLETEKTAPEDAGVPAHTLVLQTEPCGNVFRAGNDIVINENGGFFRASRVDAGKVSRPRVR